MKRPISPSLLRLEAMAQGITPRGVVAICRDACGSPEDLFAQERAAIKNAVAKRQAEFSAGRAAARAGLELLGLVPGPIAVGPDRAPVWPDGFSGSISHCRDAAIAVVCSASPTIGHIGVDVELAGALEPDLWQTICTPRERGALGGLADPGERVKLIFSIKEAVYKAQYPLTGRLLDFQDVEVSAHDCEGTFTAVIQDPNVPRIRGTFRTSPEFVLAFAATERL